MIGSKNAGPYAVVGPDQANSAKPAAAIVGPAISGNRAPSRSSKPPAQRDSTPMITVNGRNTVPASVAEYPCTWIRSNVDVGVDTRTGVNDKDYQVPFAFNGKIDKLTVKLGPTQLTSEEHRIIQHARARAND